jgi:hypothetical protein
VDVKIYLWEIFFVYFSSSRRDGRHTGSIVIRGKVDYCKSAVEEAHLSASLPQVLLNPRQTILCSRRFFLVGAQVCQIGPSRFEHLIICKNMSSYGC